MKATWLFAALAFSGLAGGPQAASAADAYTTTNVNMRAGPSTHFPRITTLPAGAAVTIYGCTRSWDWCDTSWRGLRGWVSAHYLESLYDDRRVIVPDYGPSIGVPIITFEFGTYWDRWYQDLPWYSERDRWRREWRSGWTVEIEPRRTYRAIEPELRRRDVPPGIRKKGPGFCPPGLRKQGRC
ncbi:SH3 domain-containing protein [Chelativorans alearense]|uniref:SH3 domain-containing protein n=1 Tax=Chelativorans alearense TaxID=2681495 RepID=UPI0013CF4995|nr:SH3 domain-containing protein [Chelativorans alearense]